MIQSVAEPPEPVRREPIPEASSIKSSTVPSGLAASVGPHATSAPRTPPRARVHDRRRSGWSRGLRQRAGFSPGR